MQNGSVVRVLYPLLSRARPLLRLASEYTAAQISARLLAAVAGLLLVRLLPVEEYGFYTLVLAAFTFICTFSDLGATETLSFFRWRAAKKNKSWTPYFHAVMRFRRTVFFLGLIASAVYVFYTARHLHEEMPIVLAGIALMGVSAWFAIHSGVIAYALKLEQCFRHAYAIELTTEGVKLLVVGLIWAMGFATALAGMASVALGALASAVLATHLLENRITGSGWPKQRQSRHNSRALLAQIVPTFPGAIHFALQGVLTAWLAAYFGSAQNVAEVGALGRLGVLISLISGFTGSVFVPRLIAIGDGSLFLKRYLIWWLLIVALGSVIVFAIWIFSSQLLPILGNHYRGLTTELLIVSATAVIATWGGFAWNINRARGWITYQPYSVAFIGTGQIAMLYSMNFSGTANVLLFGLITTLLGAGYQIALNVVGFRTGQ